MGKHTNTFRAGMERSFLFMGLSCVTHTLAFTHTTLHVKFVLGEGEEVKNRYETDEFNYLVLVSQTLLPFTKSYQLQLRRTFMWILGCGEGDQNC